MNGLVDRIATGQATLLGVEEICTRIGVSRTTFDRWVRNGGGQPSSKSLARHIAETAGLSSNFLDTAENMTEGTIKFPPPDIRIGNSPKWEIETFKRWLTANMVVVAK